MKIIVAGAGIGGLYAAGRLAKAGHDVTVYEREKSARDMRYDWYDDVSPKVFEKLSIPLPEGSFPKRDWTFCAPYGDASLYCTQDPHHTDYSVERQPLNDALINNLSGAKLIFGSNVSGAAVENGAVVGAYVDGKLVDCDLLIDSAGVNSPVRNSVAGFFGFETVDKGETFFAYRAMYELIPGAPVPEKDTNKVYLKHLGENGISWCIYQPQGGYADVLVGRTHELTEETLDKAMTDLRAQNPFYTDKVVRGGRRAIIPVRKPLSLFVANGYAAIGDAACFTIPMIGSGIESSLNAGEFLAETVISKNSSKVEVLWEYQVKCFKEFGARHVGVDVMKKWLLGTAANDVKYFLTSGVITEKDMNAAAIGKPVKVTIDSIPARIKNIRGHAGFVLSLLGILDKSKRGVSAAKMIPKTYNEKTVARWIERYKKL